MAQARKYSAVRSLPDARAVDSFLCSDNYLSLTESAHQHRLLFISELSKARVSAFLGWLFRPHEGHGLGGQAIRGLIHAAWKQVNSGEWEGASASVMGFTDWTPSHFASRSFCDLCRETKYRFGKRTQPGTKRPVHVVLVSRANKLLILIENKYGSAVHSGQLRAYREQADKNYPGYRIFRVYLDLNDENKPDDDQYWINLRYDWLIELIAARQTSGLLSERDLNALSQVKDYLEQESADVGKMDRQAQIAALVYDHEDVLHALRDLRKLGRHGRLAATRDAVPAHLEVLMTEYHQRYVLWDNIFSQMAHMHLIGAVRKALENSVEIRKFSKRLALRRPDWSRIRNPAVKADAAWCLRMAAWKPEEKGNLHSVRCALDFGPVASNDGSEVPAHTAEQEQALRAMADQLRQMKKKSSSGDGWIRIMEQKNLAPNAAAKVLIKEKARTDTALREHGLLLTDT